VPDQFCSVHAQTLLILNLSNNCLSEFPVALCFMPALSQLIVGSNQLKKIPSEIGKLEAMLTAR
jgi:Leucine-rich repeat (LRR) protein